MLRVAVIALLAAAVLAGCASKVDQQPPAAATQGSATIRDPEGDAVDASGNRRRGRPDVDIAQVGIDRNSSRTLFAITTVAPPRGPLRYEIFAQASEVAGYDLVRIARDGNRLTGYLAFENSAARQKLEPPQALSADGARVGVNIPIDPIFGAMTFEWRVTVRTASGAAISDVLPSPSGLRAFPHR